MPPAPIVFIATATHVVSLGAASLVVVATVLELLPAVEVVDVPKTKLPLLLVVQLIGGPQVTDVNTDDEGVVFKADVEVLIVGEMVGNEITDDVVLIVVAELEYPPYEAIMLLYLYCQKPFLPPRLQRPYRACRSRAARARVDSIWTASSNLCSNCGEKGDKQEYNGRHCCD
jgi:hypothetical protein